MMGESSSSKHLATNLEYGSSSFAHNERTEDGRCDIEEQIEKSKSHWSHTTEMDHDDLDAEVSNVEVFKALQMHPTWGTFFPTFGEGGVGELVIGKKFAEGGQAEIYEAQIEFNDPKMREYLENNPRRFVLKVFKKGTFLQHLQSQWPQGMLQFHEERMKRTWRGVPQLFRYHCDVYCGTLLTDGRFAFVMVKEQEDLRCLINRGMSTSNKGCGPFSKQTVETIMYRIALGMDWLHRRGIVHRDLKASNVLCSTDKGCWGFYVADFECSIGVIGTGFFRAPEILQACKERNVSQRPELFTKEADVYSYGMTCYEILTGKLPFEGHSLQNYDLVLKGQRPEVPKYVDDWIQVLLNRCWQSNPATRPSFEEILDILLTCSDEIRDIKKRCSLRERGLGMKMDIDSCFEG